MIDYSICARSELSLAEVRDISANWDVFISAYNKSDRVQRVFSAVSAPRKLWLVQRGYGFSAADLPEGAFHCAAESEAEFWHEFEDFAGTEWTAGTLCVDITGFMRPQLTYLVTWLLAAKRTSFLALYTDPTHYSGQENTVFSKGPVMEVRQVSGCEGAHTQTLRRTVW